MPRGRVKGTKLSAAHKAAVSLGLKKHFVDAEVWNKGLKKPKAILSAQQLEQKKALSRKKKSDAALLFNERRRFEVIQKEIELAGSSWTTLTFDRIDGIRYIAATHVPCGTRICVQAQTVRKWNFGSGLCKTCNPVFRGSSKLEDELYNFIFEIDKSAIRHFKLKSGLELDVVSQKHKIAIELHGLYWHSDKIGYDRFRTVSKKNQAEELGFQLVQIFEDEWTQQRQIVESRLRAKFGVAKRIFARKLNLDLKVSAAEATKFLQNTHIQGNAQSSIRFGLRDGDKLLALATFGKSRFRTDSTWELIRYCTALDTTVVGGASRLLSAFKMQHSGTIISYADLRWSNGNLYEELGFTRHGQTGQSYFYFKGDLRKNRQNFQKSKLKVLLGTSFDESKTEVDLMFSAGWNRIWDCGSAIYKLTDSK